MLDHRSDQFSYAKLYSKLTSLKTPISTHFLAFRDLPELLGSYEPNSKALDYGCGIGNSTRELKKMGFDATGIDISKDMIGYALQDDPKGNYKVIESGHIPDKDESYDFVFSFWVLMSMTSKQELHDVVKEIARVLKKGGFFIPVLFNENSYNNIDWLSHNTQFEENKGFKSGSKVRLFIKEMGLDIFDYFWSEADYKDALAAAGLELIKIHKPLGRDNEGYHWVKEKEIPIANIYLAKKI
jgi:ubiquinone/menaquinone biosynthesis C-methylase UbiE